jgi:hypothetical protein
MEQLRLASSHPKLPCFVTPCVDRKSASHAQRLAFFSEPCIATTGGMPGELGLWDQEAVSCK